MGRYLPILGPVRRRAGAILPLEASILATAVDLAKAGTSEFHGFQLAKQLREDEGQRQLTAHGTLYKALSRMEKAGLLSSVWEDPDRAAAEGRPRRRLYSITSDGRIALARVEAEAESLTELDPGWSAS
jgi:PadR family transcriptional regulator PadR